MQIKLDESGSTAGSCLICVNGRAPNLNSLWPKIGGFNARASIMIAYGHNRVNEWIFGGIVTAIC